MCGLWSRARGRVSNLSWIAPSGGGSDVLARADDRVRRRSRDVLASRVGSLGLSGRLVLRRWPCQVRACARLPERRYLAADPCRRRSHRRRVGDGPHRPDARRMHRALGSPGPAARCVRASLRRPISHVGEVMLPGRRRGDTNLYPGAGAVTPPRECARPGSHVLSTASARGRRPCPFGQHDPAYESTSDPMTNGQIHPLSICSTRVSGRTEHDYVAPVYPPTVRDRLLARRRAEVPAGGGMSAARRRLYLSNTPAGRKTT